MSHGGIKSKTLEFWAFLIVSELTLITMASVNNTKCGLSWCGYPQFLQRFANTKSFILVYGFLGTIQSMGYVYFAITLQTMEKRFKIPSQTTGEWRDSQALHKRYRKIKTNSDRAPFDAFNVVALIDVNLSSQASFSVETKCHKFCCQSCWLISVANVIGEFPWSLINLITKYL